MAKTMQGFGLMEGYAVQEEHLPSKDSLLEFGGNPSEAPMPLGPGLAIDYATSSPGEEDFGPFYEHDEPMHLADSMSPSQPPLDNEDEIGCASSGEYDEHNRMARPLHSSGIEREPNGNYPEQECRDKAHSSDQILRSQSSHAIMPINPTNKQPSEPSLPQIRPMGDVSGTDIPDDSRNHVITQPNSNENVVSSLQTNETHSAIHDDRIGKHQEESNVQSRLHLPIPPLRESVLRRLSDALTHGTLIMVNLSHRGLVSGDATVIKAVLLNNPYLTELKLSYNCLGDGGATLISSAVCWTNGRGHFEHHGSLSLLDMGFNGVGDNGCESLAASAVARNPVIRTLYLSGNAIGEKGAIALAGAIMNGSGLTCLHLTVNRAGIMGVLALSSAITENERRRRASLLSNETHCLDLSEAATEFNFNFKSIEELFLGGTSMGARGCLSISNMLLTNSSLRVLCLADNGINDRDLALFSQAISRNRNVPLEVIRLSFNKLTCVGVESLMNAIWGSETLREVCLDNNYIRDRGAQLAAVVLTSVRLETLDLGFNQITAVGIRALMKSLITNDSLKSLTLSGTALDINASKAVSFALAHNQSLRTLYFDNCSVGYAAQRHIAAGIVSNSNPSLRLLTGFGLGAIAVTMGLPKALEHWSNDKALKFFRLMWERRRSEQAEPATSGSDSEKKRKQVGPSDPATVILAANNLFSTFDGNDDSWASRSNQSDLFDGSPLVPNDAIMLERTELGTIRVPPTAYDEDNNETASTAVLNCANPQGSFAPAQPDTPVNPLQRKRNSDWTKNHMRALHGLAQIPFNDADLWQLHQYFFSPLDLPVVQPKTEMKINLADASFSSGDPHDPAAKSGPQIERQIGNMARKASYRLLNDAVVTPNSSTQAGVSEAHHDSTNRRRTLSVMDGNVSDSIDFQPASKRARNNKPRIEYYPRIQEKLERLRANVNQEQALVLLRQLKYIEGVLFEGRDVYSYLADKDESNQPSTADVEAILDML